MTARADYGKLDVADAPVRIRLDSTVMRVRHDGAPDGARQVEVTYLKNGKLHAVTGCMRHAREIRRQWGRQSGPSRRSRRTKLAMLSRRRTAAVGRADLVRAGMTAGL